MVDLKCPSFLKDLCGMDEPSTQRVLDFFTYSRHMDLTADEHEELLEEKIFCVRGKTQLSVFLGSHKVRPCVLFGVCSTHERRIRDTIKRTRMSCPSFILRVRACGAAFLEVLPVNSVSSWSAFGTDKVIEMYVYSLWSGEPLGKTVERRNKYN